MPNRIIKESICYSDSIKSLSWFEEVVFYRLIVNADDYGRLDARMEMLQAKLFPLRRDITDSTIKKALNALTAAGMVQTYNRDGSPFLQLTAWERHQQIRAKKSKYPAPDVSSDNSCNHLQSFEINCNQLKSDEIKCPRNPIQSNPNPNPNPKREYEDGEEPPSSAPKQKKHRYGEYGRVQLSDKEHTRLIEEFGQDKVDYYITYLDEFAEGNGNKSGWKNWNLVMRRAIREGWGKYGQDKSTPGKPGSQWDLPGVSRL